MLWDRTYSFLSLYEKTRKSNHLQMSFTKAALSSQLFKDPEGWPSWPGVETMTSCSADWRSPNWDNQGAVKFITNPPKKTCMQATKAMTGFFIISIPMNLNSSQMCKHANSNKWNSKCFSNFWSLITTVSSLVVPAALWWQYIQCY